MNATWEMRFLRNKQILRIRLSGTLDLEDETRLVKELGAMNLDPAQTSILVDHRAENINLRTMEIYSLPEPYQSVENSLLFRVALVFRQLGPNELFYETVCYNRGYSGIRVFDDYRKAMDWLMTGANWPRGQQSKRMVQREDKKIPGSQEVVEPGQY